MNSHVGISISFLHRTLSYTERTNIYKNQIILNMLSASNWSTKNRVTPLRKTEHRYVFFLHILSKEKMLEKFFFTVVKLVKSPTKIVLAAFYLDSDFRRKSRLKDEHFKFRVLLGDSVTRSKNLSRNSRVWRELVIFIP
jgi:hypothetical protein